MSQFSTLTWKQLTFGSLKIVSKIHVHMWRDLCVSPGIYTYV